MGDGNGLMSCRSAPTFLGDNLLEISVGQFSQWLDNPLGTAEGKRRVQMMRRYYTSVPLTKKPGLRRYPACV